MRCTSCGGNTVFYGFARPRKIIIGGDKYTIPLRRARCKHCDVTHVIVPDFVSPYKHYSVFDIELAVIDMESGLHPEKIDSTADASTIRRWHKSFKGKVHRVTAGLMSVLITHFNQTVNNVSTVAQTVFARLALVLDNFPDFKRSDFLFSRSNLILSNFAHTHTLHGMSDASFVKLWLSP